MMRLSVRWAMVILVLLAFVGSAVPLTNLRAQQNTVTISVAIPGFQRDSFSDKMIGDFEAANPGVKVSVVTPDVTIPDPALGLDAHFSALDQYASAADVLFVNANSISVEATHAGYFLDLAPLVGEDKKLNVDDFYPSVWQSFQWDNGIWALPTAANVIVMTYKPAAFDQAGIAYPTDKWTMDDLSNAVTKLAQKDSTGAVTIHGLDLYSPYATAVLFRVFIGEGLYDSSQVPNSPALEKPAVESMLDAYHKMDADSLIGSDLNTAPLSLSPATAILVQNAINQDDKRVAMLLPGGKAGLDVQGFAISKGTQNPDQAYALASFLTTRAETAGAFASAPARKSLIGSDGANGGFRLNVSAEVQAVINQGVANGIPLSEVRFGNYLALAANKMKLEKSTTAQAAIQDVQTTLTTNLKAADDKKGKLNVVVATPIPDTVVAGKVPIKFGLLSFQRPLPNKDKWDKLVQDFTANDPQIGEVTIEQPSGFTLSAEQLAGKYDCFYLPFNSVPDIQNFGQLLNFDPYLSTDKSFDPSDVIGNSMQQVTRDNKIWALPIEIEPEILKYDSQQFDKAGATAPRAGWTVDAFNDALKKLKPDSSAKPPFVSSGFGGTHLLILIATYGGLPIDFRTSPPTLNYTEPKTVDAIRQVLDIAKSGYIKYTAIGTLNFLGTARPQDVAIYNTALNAFNIRPNTDNNTQADVYKTTTYPTGKQYNAVSYSIGTAYISARSQNADGCYRWISTIAKNAQLFNGMPARYSILNDPAQATAQGADTIALYKQIAALIQAPNTLSIPSLVGARQSFFVELWLFQAFDSYVLKNGDLESSLKDAQDKGNALTECVGKITPYDPLSTDSIKQYARDYGACVTKIDPSYKALFGLIQ